MNSAQAPGRSGSCCRHSGLLGPLLLLLLGCGGGRGLEEGILFREPSFPNVLEAGMAVAPVGHLEPVEDAGRVSAFFTNELYVDLLVDLEGTALVAPREVLEQLTLHGEDAYERFRDFRRRVAASESIPREEYTRMSQLVLHRYLLLTWVDEQKKMGLEDMSTDYVESGFANDVRRAAFETIHGTLEGEIVDLWEAQAMWRGRVNYQTERLFGDTKVIKSEIERARTEGVTRFVALVAAR